MNIDEDEFLKGRTIYDELSYNSYHVIVADGKNRKAYSNLIICCKTGLFFDHQYDHYGCTHTNIEGFPLLVCVHNIYNPCNWLECFTDEELRAEAHKVNESLANYEDDLQRMIGSLKFDYDRINEFREGLIPVDVLFIKYFNALMIRGDELNKRLEPKLMKGYLFLDKRIFIFR